MSSDRFYDKVLTLYLGRTTSEYDILFYKVVCLTGSIGKCSGSNVQGRRKLGVPAELSSGPSKYNTMLLSTQISIDKRIKYKPIKSMPYTNRSIFFF